MTELTAVFERNGLFQKKEEVVAHISLKKGMVDIETSDSKLKTKIMDLIASSEEYIRAQWILEETAILNKIEDQLKGLKFNRTTFKRTSYHPL